LFKLLRSEFKVLVIGYLVRDQVFQCIPPGPPVYTALFISVPLMK
jgi:hypothetical protein